MATLKVFKDRFLEKFQTLIYNIILLHCPQVIMIDVISCSQYYWCPNMCPKLFCKKKKRNVRYWVYCGAEYPIFLVIVDHNQK